MFVDPMSATDLTGRNLLHCCGSSEAVSQVYSSLCVQIEFVPVCCPNRIYSPPTCVPLLQVLSRCKDRTSAINAPDAFGCPPLLSMSNSAIIRGFVSRAGTAGVRSCDRSGMTALHHAALRCITQENPIPRKPAQEHDLFLFRCDKESAAELLSHSADVFARDIHDRTPLHIAAFSGASDITLLLCKNKADVHAKDKFGFAILCFLVFFARCFRDFAFQEHCSSLRSNARTQGMRARSFATWSKLGVCFMLPLLATFDASLVAF